MEHRSLLFLCLLIASIACSSPVAVRQQVQPELRLSVYLVASVEELQAMLPPPPVPGSIAARADLETVLQVQTWRTPEQAAWARKVDDLDPFDNAEALGEWFRKADLPRLSALVKRVRGDIHPLMASAKKRFDRPRPPLVDPAVRPVLAMPRGSSYPSGHTLILYVDAFVLGEIFPDRRDALLARAHRAAWSRVLAGVHFPSDVVAGRVLAEAVFADLMKNGDFRTEAEDCRREAASLRLAEAG